MTGTDGEFLPQGVDLGDFPDVLCAAVECCGESASNRITTGARCGVPSFRRHYAGAPGNTGNEEEPRRHSESVLPQTG